MRTTTAAQDTALAALDRATHVRVKIDDADGTPQDLSDLQGEDFLDQVVIDAQTDVPISACTLSLRREVAGHSVSPLREDSLINRDSAGAYAAFLNPNRDVTVEIATMLAGETPASGDWVLIWEGITDEVDWGGQGSTCRVHCRDPMSRLNDTFIETEANYGDDGGTKDVEDVIQDILTAEISSPAVTLAFTATSYPIREYPLANVTVLEACQALIDIIGWNLHWMYNVSAAAFRLTLWEPDRSNTTAAHTFGQDDYYVIPAVGLNLEGIRNKGEIVYLTTSGTIGTATDTRTVSQTLYSTRFIRIDTRGTSVVTATQATNMLSAIMDDLEEPSVQQQIECAFFWPVELGDLYAFSPNDHYDTEQKWAVFGYRHILSNSGPKRTVLTVSGKASGGYERWHQLERTTAVRRQAPTVAMTVAQSGSTGSVDLAIADPDLTIRTVEFAEKTDAGTYGALASTWDRTSGTAGLDVALTRGEDITLVSKHSVSIRYVVTYDDGDGSGDKTVQGAHSFDDDFVAEVTHIEVMFDANGEAVVSATGDEDTANMYVTVGDGSAPSDPTSGVNDGSISGRNGTVSTGIAITTGNDAYVKVIGYNSTPAAGPVRSTRQARRLGPFHKDTTSRTHTGDTVETTLETITIPANSLGSNGGLVLTLATRFAPNGAPQSWTLRFKLGGTTFQTIALSTPNQEQFHYFEIFNDGATNVQQIQGYSLMGASVHQPAFGVDAEDSTSAMDVTITAQLTVSADTLQLRSSLARFVGTD